MMLSKKTLDLACDALAKFDAARATLFRTGDIVRLHETPFPLSRPPRVLSVDGGRLRLDLDGCEVAATADDCVLLRRPVRIADILHDYNGKPYEVIADLGGSLQLKRLWGNGATISNLACSDFKHEDGTAIEPTVTADPKAKPTCGAVCGEYVCNGYPEHTHDHRQVENCAIAAMWPIGYSPPRGARLILGTGNRVTGHTLERSDGIEVGNAPLPKVTTPIEYPKINGILCAKCMQPVPDAAQEYWSASGDAKFCSSACKWRAVAGDHRPVSSGTFTDEITGGVRTDEEVASRAREALRRLSPNYGTRQDLRDRIAANIPMTITVEDACRAILGEDPSWKRKDLAKELNDAARAFFDTDPVVRRFIAGKCDAEVRVLGPEVLQREGRPKRDTTFTTDDARFERALGVCWAIDDGGHKTRWIEHVKAAVEREKGQR